MKPGTLIAALICSSVGLAGAILVVAKTRPASPAGPTSGPTVQFVTNATTRFVRERAALPEATVLPTAFSWHSVESEDYRQYIENLRALGCPEETIRDIIVADINKLYAPREAPLKASLQTAAAGLAATTESPDADAQRATRAGELEWRKQLRALQQEKNALLKELLGLDLPLDTLWPRDGRNRSLFEAAFNALPAEKRERVREIQETYWQSSDALRDQHGRRRTSEFLAEYQRLNQERKTQLAQVLTPQELDGYEMRVSSVANSLRTPDLDAAANSERGNDVAPINLGACLKHVPYGTCFRQSALPEGHRFSTGAGVLSLRSSLEQFKPSEEEFREIYQLRKQLDEPYEGRMRAGQVTDAAGNPVDESQAAATRQQQANEQLRTALGEQRFAEYQRWQDSSYRQLNNLSERYGLAQDAVLQAYEIQKTTSEQTRKLRSDSTLTKEQRDSALQAIQAETAQALSQALGERAYNALRRRGGAPAILTEDMVVRGVTFE